MIKRVSILWVCLIMIIVMTSCTVKQEKISSEISQSIVISENSSDIIAEDRKILVVYFSVTGNTEALARAVSEYYQTDLFEIEALIPYTDEDIDYNNRDSRTSKEQNDKSVRPKIAESINDIDQYDTIILAYPIWWGQAPRIIDTFMESYDFDGKNIIPVCTSGSSDIGLSDDYLHSFTENAVWKDGKRFSSEIDTNLLYEWLDSIIE